MGKWRTIVTSTAWNNLAYYGRKLKADFQIIDTYIQISLQRDDGKKGIDIKKLEEANVDTLLKMMRHKTIIAITVNKLVETLDTTKRLEDIEKLIEAISPEALLEAKISIAK